MRIKCMLEQDPKRVLDNCYFFTMDPNSNVPKIPYYSVFNNLYDLLNSLNVIDRNLRITDWYTEGLVITKGNRSILYIKPPLEAITRIKEINYNVSRTGTIIPIVKFDPVSFNGVLALQATFYNSKILLENKLQINDIITIMIKRQGHQATEVSSVILPYSSKTSVPSLSKCPSCNSTLVKKRENEYLTCINDFCQEKLIRRILHWCSREAMNIKGLGIKFVEYLVINKIVTTIDDIYTLTITDLCKVPGILHKMASNIIAEINDSKTKPLVNVFIGFGIEHIGKSASKLLAWQCLCVRELLDINKKNINNLSALLAKEQMNSILEYLSSEVNREVLLHLSRHLNPKLPEIKINNHVYFKKTFVIRGGFPGFKRDRIKTLLTRSGIYVNSPNAKVFDYCLFCNDRNMVYTLPSKKVIKLSKLLLTLID